MFRNKFFNGLLMLRKNILQNNFRSNTNITSSTANESSAEPVKEKLKEKWIKYWKNLYIDYREVGKDVIEDIKARPGKNFILFSLFSGLTYCARTNPDERSFRDTLINLNNELILLSEKSQNPKTAEHFKFIESCYNGGILRRLSLGFVSLIWVDNFDEACKLYKCTCTYLKPKYLTFSDRVIDVGFVGKWWILEEKFKDYDVNDSYDENLVLWK